MMNSYESTFPKDYRQEDVERVLQFVLAGKFCQLISLPGGGKATLLRLLAYHPAFREQQALFFYFNLLELPNLEETTIEKFLLLNLGQKEMSDDPMLLWESLKEKVREITSGKTLVLLLDHFDEFQNQLPPVFYQRLRTLKKMNKNRFAVVFATRRDLAQLLDPEVLREFYDFFLDNTVYMRLFDQKASEILFSQVENQTGKKLTPREKKEILTLTAGHTKLTKVIAERILQEKIPITAENLLENPLVQASLFELWLFLTPQEQHQLLNPTQDKVPEPFGLFSIPLFAEFITRVVKNLKQEVFVFDQKNGEIKKGETIISDLLSSQEYRLLKFLLENKERIIDREEIIDAVWTESKTQAGVTDQALDQMIFRLRKKIEDEADNPKHLLTVKGRGFKFLP